MSPLAGTPDANGPIVNRLKKLATLASVGLLLAGVPLAAQAQDVAPVRSAFQCYALAYPTSVAPTREGERRRLCSLPITAPDRQDLRAEVWETRQGARGAIQTVNVLASNGAGGDRTLWSYSGTGLGGFDVVESLVDVRTFTPPGEAYGQVALATVRCGAYCGGSAVFVVRVVGETVESVLEVEGGPDPALSITGPGVLVRWQDRMGPAYAPAGTVNALYAWSPTGYVLVDQVLEESGLPNTGRSAP